MYNSSGQLKSGRGRFFRAEDSDISFPWMGVHEILGVSLFVFWGIHVSLNRRWYA